MQEKDRVRMEVLLEEIRDKVNIVAEGHEILKREIQETRRELKEEMDNRFTPIEFAIQNLSGRVGNLENGQRNLEKGQEVLIGRVGNLEKGHRNLEIGQIEIKNEIKKIHFRLDDHEARIKK